MDAAAIRAINGLSLDHEPIQENSIDVEGKLIPANRAHSEVFGEKDEERRLKLLRIFNWEIRI